MSIRKACTADCDQRIFKHCTPECKCDYAYPYVQKFCNPPPLPLFLNTCRMWYNGCPKYERYHYASQFIYSKAEKGKKVELPVNSRPFSVVSPNGERIPVVVRQPGITTIARDDPLFDVTKWETPAILNAENFDPRSKEDQKNSTRKSINSARLDAKPPDPFSLTDLPGVSRLPKKLKEILPQINLHLDPSLENKKKYSDDSSRSDPVPSIPKDGKSKDVPVVPSDSVFANAVAQYGTYGALTDSSGILHRPRSRSPFTKPGLWEPNPDDPHNRDHANKWFYYPESVNVDWLSGQLAWGAHWAVPAAGVGGTDGYSTVHFPSIGTFLNIPDDYD